MTNQLNITAGTDVLLHVSLEHDGMSIDPLIIEDLSATLVSGLGKQTSLEASAEADYIVVSVPWVEGRLPGCHSLKISGSTNGLVWVCVGKSLIKYTSGTEPGTENVTVVGDAYDVTMEVGYHYTDSPINEVAVTVDGGVGTPTGDAEYSKKKLTIHLHDIKGGKGDRGNGIASIGQLEENLGDGERNVWRITEDDGEVTDIILYNGHKGDSVIVGQGDLPLTHVLGEDYTKAMSQKGVTDAINTLARANLFVDVVESGFFVVDSMNYIGFYVDETGAHAPNVVEFRD